MYAFFRFLLPINEAGIQVTGLHIKIKKKKEEERKKGQNRTFHNKAEYNRTEVQ